MKPTLGLALLAAFGLVISGCASPPSDDPATAGTGEAPAAVISPALAESADSALLRPGMVATSYSAGLPGIKPGGGCTANFLFRSPSNGTYYFGTAAHCLHSEPGTTTALGLNGNQFIAGGLIVYSSFVADDAAAQGFDEKCNSNPVMGLSNERLCWNDFALIEINASTAAIAHPTLRVFGGPNAGEAGPEVGAQLYTVGSSYYRAGNQLPDARAGVIVDVGAWRVLGYFSVPGTAGDSGSPVLDEQGHALGVLTTLNYGPAGSNGIALLSQLLGAAAEHGWVVEVVAGDVFEAPPA